MHWPDPFVPQRHILPNFILPKRNKLTENHIPHNIATSPNTHIDPLPAMLTNLRVKLKFPEIPPNVSASATTYLSITNNARQNTFTSTYNPPVTAFHCWTKPGEYTPDLNLWRFHKNKPKNFERGTKNAAAFSHRSTGITQPLTIQIGNRLHHKT